MIPWVRIAEIREFAEDIGRPADDRSDETDCLLCGDSYALREGCDPTAFCDPCAQAIADQARENLPFMLQQHDKVATDLNEMRRSWRNAFESYQEAVIQLAALQTAAAKATVLLVTLDQAGHLYPGEQAELKALLGLLNPSLFAGVAELVNAPDVNSGDVDRAGSSPASGVLVPRVAELADAPDRQSGDCSHAGSNPASSYPSKPRC